MDTPVVWEETERHAVPDERVLHLWRGVLSYPNFHDSFIETDSIGCGTQLNRKVPPDENNFSWARLSLLRRLRPLENKPGRLSPLSVSKPPLLDLIWNTVLIHFLNWPHVYLFCTGLIRISKKKMSADRETIISKIRIWLTIWGQAQE